MSVCVQIIFPGIYASGRFRLASLPTKFSLNLSIKRFSVNLLFNTKIKKSHKTNKIIKLVSLRGHSNNLISIKFLRLRALTFIF